MVSPACFIMIPILSKGRMQRSKIAFQMVIPIRLHRVPATMGREIFTQYAPTAMPKVGDYKSNQGLMHKLIAFVKVEAPDGSMVRLSPQLLDAHVTDFEMLIKLEWEMVKFNTSFLNRENRSNLLKKFKVMAEKYLSTLTSSQSSD